MTGVSEKSLDKIKSILQKYVPECEVWAFGSRVKGTSREYSDLDLAIVGKEKLGISKLGDIEEEFMKSEIPFRVDVLDYNDVSPDFKKIINSNYEVI